MIKKEVLTAKRNRSRTRHEFLLTFFEGKVSEGYAEKEVNGYWLVRQWNGNSKMWEVAIYTQENFGRRKEYQRSFFKEG